MKYLSIFLIVFTGLPLLAQDSLVFFNELKFESDFERTMFNTYLNNTDSSHLALFLATNPDMDQELYSKYRQQYDAHLRALPMDKINKKKKDKQIKAIYDEVHNRFFKKYEEINDFSNIFSKGYYNCVSATALYGMIFSQLNIPYIIKEKPTHVYLVAYPGSENVVVESTDPTGGFMTASDKYKEVFVEQLKNAKIISAEEFASKSVMQLFDEYYFSDPDISLIELAGIQYTNHALYALDNTKNRQAYTLLEKAHYLYPCERTATLMLTVGGMILQNTDYSAIEDVDYIAKMARFSKYGVTHEMIVAEFAGINETFLINKNDTAAYSARYHRLLDHINDNSLKKEIEYLYHYERGRVLYNSGKYDLAITFFERAYENNPDNLDINNVLVSALALSIRFESNISKIVEKLESFKENHESLMDNNIFKSLLVDAYLTKCGQSYDLGKINDAAKYQVLFENNYNEELMIEEDKIGRVYSLAAIYYFKKGQTSKAKSILNKGLSYAPASYELQMRKRMIH